MTVDYSGNQHATLVFAFNIAEGRGGWFWDQYTPGVIVHYGEEGDGVHALLTGTESGVVHQMTGDDDEGTAIGCHIRTGARDQGDSRLHKLYGDIWVDADTRSQAISAYIGYDNFTSKSSAITLNTATRTDYPLNPDSSNWVSARNVGLELMWDSTKQSTGIYQWEPRWHEDGAPVNAFSWNNDDTDFGLKGFVYSGYLYLPHKSTADLSLVFYLDNVEQTALTIANSAGASVKSFIRLPVMKAKLWKLKISSTAQFSIAGNEAELLIKQWGGGGPWQRVPLFADQPTSEKAA